MSRRVARRLHETALRIFLGRSFVIFLWTLMFCILVSLVVSHRCYFGLTLMTMGGEYRGLELAHGDFIFVRRPPRSNVSSDTGWYVVVLPSFDSPTLSLPRSAKFRDKRILKYAVPLWMTVPLILATIVGIYRLRRRFHVPSGYCTCGYDLRGSISDRCSECGAPIVGKETVKGYSRAEKGTGPGRKVRDRHQ